MEDVLRKAFAAAHQRPGLIFLDLLWKAIWLIATIAALLLVAAWFGSGVRAIAWQDTGVRPVNVWIATTLLRELWEASKAEILWTVSSVLLLSAFSWLFLEAFVRSRMVDQSKTKLFFASGASKAMILAAMGIVMIPVCILGATTLAAVIFLTFDFFLTILDTLIRGDAVDLLGTDLIRVTGLIGILVSFETMVGASCVVLLIAGFLHVARLMDATVMLGAACVCIVFLNLLHGYLLLVRFSAIDIMRRNVVEV
jgi:hypothetical protein